jgi:hypothetical protein
MMKNGFSVRREPSSRDFDLRRLHLHILVSAEGATTKTIHLHSQSPTVALRLCRISLV